MTSHPKHDQPRGGPAAGAAASPAELARRVLTTLAERRLQPTPEAFAAAYYAAAGATAGVTAADVLKGLLRDLSRQHRVGGPEAGQILERAEQHDWLAVRDGVDKALARRTGAVAENWPVVTLRLMRQVDALHAGWTRARKLEAVTRVIDAAAAHPELAFERLTRLVESWGTALAAPADSGAVPSVLAAIAPPPGPGSAPATAPAPAPAPAPVDRTELLQARAEAEAWRQIAGRGLKMLAQSLAPGTPAHDKLTEFSTQVGTAGGAGANSVAAERLVPRFTDVVSAIERQDEEQQRVRSGLQRLLALLCDNMKTLAPDEAWLAGQLEPIRAVLDRPLGAESLAAAEQRLTQVIARQSGARKGLLETKVALREMLSSLIERSGTMGSSAGRFSERVGRYQADLERADDIASLSKLVRGLLLEAKGVQAEFEQSRVALVAERQKAEAYEARVRDLEQELTQVATLVMQDPLTSALNRRGLEQSFRIESARALRQRAPLSVAVLDLDDFKAINDRHGHAAGDQVLVHLVAGLRGSLRATDLMARTGGEEFAILMPAIDCAAAATIAARLLGEVAGAPLLHEGQRIAMTCSVGVAQWRQGESLEALMKRADTALYDAKRSGKNRVAGA